mmetsp:Transcript_99009/g.263060  ORF Transcript_99009/g.263060 Transcript_99009/m.263060 type:complete len:264 (-) Transcript_99009:1240-2031(-)
MSSGRQARGLHAPQPVVILQLLQHVPGIVQHAAVHEAGGLTLGNGRLQPSNVANLLGILNVLNKEGPCLPLLQLGLRSLNLLAWQATLLRRSNSLSQHAGLHLGHLDAGPQRCKLHLGLLQLRHPLPQLLDLGFLEGVRLLLGVPVLNALVESVTLLHLLGKDRKRLLHVRQRLGLHGLAQDLPRVARHLLHEAEPGWVHLLGLHLGEAGHRHCGPEGEHGLLLALALIFVEGLQGKLEPGTSRSLVAVQAGGLALGLLLLVL